MAASREQRCGGTAAISCGSCIAGFGAAAAAHIARPQAVGYAHLAGCLAIFPGSLAAACYGMGICVRQYSIFLPV